MAATKVVGEDARKQLFGTLLAINAAAAKTLQVQLQDRALVTVSATTASYDPSHAPGATAAKRDEVAQSSPVLSESVDPSDAVPLDDTDS